MKNRCAREWKRSLRNAWLLMAAAQTTGAFALAAGAQGAEGKYEATVQRGVAAKMRDGATLRADIYRPKAEGKFPVLLVRTPYDKRNSAEFAFRAAENGFVAIVQDVR